MMNPQIKAAWVAKLRSGEIKQTHGRLCDEKGMCCLGVLCQIHKEFTGLGMWLKYRDVYKYLEYNGVLPPDVISWASVTSEDPLILGYHLSTYNDGSSYVRTHTFEEIATLIEQYL